MSSFFGRGQPNPRDANNTPNQFSAATPAAMGSRPRDRPQQPSHNRPEHISLNLSPVNSPSALFTFKNLVAVSPIDFPESHIEDTFDVLVKDFYVFKARIESTISRGCIGLSKPQRNWADIALQDLLHVQLLDPNHKGAQRYIGTMTAELDFASPKTTTSSEFDQDGIAADAIRNFEGQVLAPGQSLLLEFQRIPLSLTVSSVTLGHANLEKTAKEEILTIPTAQGMLVKSSQILLTKAANSRLNLKASSKRAVANPILQPSFKFEDMGIGGLDKEFSAIFRRAFASRIFPQGLIRSIDVQHVKGILLYGPPGTGKTLIARQIGKMLNAREPKIINGPEVLNKFVGQSEENIRKLFADAEKEYKEKGEDSGLHIIIFDELDAVCKQRGSGAGGGTGVGDSVVNQLLSKLDGVDQLNNILLIGMTNRKDMIDDALLRPGRLEVHMEISLPDEHGRLQILNIHTAQMRKNGKLDVDVNLPAIAHAARNFSGAEISGLIRSASSFALNRYVKVGTVAGVAEDVEHLKVNRDDFAHAFEEVKPAFGVSEEELEACLASGIIEFSPHVLRILEEGNLLLNQVSRSKSTPLASVILHGPPGSGKTALAARICSQSGYPLVKLLTPNNMVGFNENMKIEHMRKVFEDAYKSSLSVIMIDNIERILGWAIGPRFDNTVLQALLVLLQKRPPQNRRLLIIATSSEKSMLQQLGLFERFDVDIAVPNVQDEAQLSIVLKQSGAFNDIPAVLEELRTLQNERQVINVGIKKILMAIEIAKQDTDLQSRFAALIAQAVNQV